MVQFAQFGLQLFLGHGGGMEWRRTSLGLVVRRQGHGALGDVGCVAIQWEDCWPVVMGNIECAMLYSSASRHDETMWVMGHGHGHAPAAFSLAGARNHDASMPSCFAAARSNYRLCKYLPLLPSVFQRA